MTKKVCSRKEKSTMLLQTELIFLREFTYDDFDSLFEILSDAEVMKYYPKPFDADRVKGWIKWNQENYKNYGFGLWAVCLKDSGKLIGDCGVTIQNIDGNLLPEIGYHIHKDFWQQGYASEAAAAVREWAFENTKYDCLYSYMKYSNVPSYKTAQKIGMKKLKEYPDEKNDVSYAFGISREEWEN